LDGTGEQCPSSKKGRMFILCYVPISSCPWPYLRELEALSPDGKTGQRDIYIDTKHPVRATAAPLTFPPAAGFC
jgi:hypothetical protein